MVIKQDLPLPEDLGELTDVDWQDLGWQTKDFHSAMNQYKLEDNELMIEKYEYEDIPGEEQSDSLWCPISKISKRWWADEDHTGYINVYDHFTREKNDYWVEFRLHFVDGTLIGAELEKFEVIDNTKRKISEAKWELEWRVRRDYEDTCRYKYCFKYWNRFISWNFRLERRIHNWCLDFTWKAERWLKF